MEDDDLMTPPTAGSSIDTPLGSTTALLMQHGSDDDDIMAPPTAGKEIVVPTVNGEMARPIANIGEYATAAFQVGQQDVIDGFKYMEAVLGHKTFEQVEADLAAAHKSVEQKNDLIKQYENANFSDNTALRFFQEAPRVGLQSAAFMGAISAGGLAEGAVLAGGSAVAGSVLGPAGTAAATGLGFGTGYAAGSFSTGAILMQGLLYRDLRKAGISHDASTWLSYGGGIVQGLIEQMQLGQVMKFGKREVQAALKQVNTSITGNLFRGTKFLAEQGAEEAAQELTGKVAETLGKYAEQGTLPTVSEYLQATAEIIQAAKGGIQGGIAAGGAAKATGATVKVSLSAAEKAAKLLTTPGVKPADFVDATMQVVAENRVPTKIEEKVHAELFKPKPQQGLDAIALSLEETKQSRTDAKTAFDAVKKKRNAFIESNPDADIPETLQQEYDSARDAFMGAKAEVKKAEYLQAKIEIEEKLTSPDITDEQKQAQQEQINKINEKLKNVKRQSSVTLMEKQQAELDEDIDRLNKRLEGKVEALNNDDNSPSLNTQLTTQVANLEAKIKAAEEKKEDRAISLWALQNDAFTDKDLNAIGTKYTGAQMTGIANFAVKRLVQAAKNTARAAIKDTRANQKMLKRLIDKSGVRNKDKSKFLRAILKGDLSKIEEIEKQINGIVEQYKQDQAQEKLDRQFDKPLKEKASLEAQAVVTAYKSMYNAVANKNQDAEKGLTVDDVLSIASKPDSQVSVSDATEPGALSSAVQRVIANDVLDTLTDAYPQKTDMQRSDRINALLAKVKDIYDTGVEQRTEQLEKQKRQTDKDLVDARLGATGFKVADGLANIVQRLKRTGITKGFFAPWNVLHAMAFQHTPTDHPVWSLFDLGKESRSEAGNVHDQTEKFLDAITNGDKDKKDLIAAGTVKKDRVTPGGKTWMKNVSDNELVQLHIQFQDETLRAGLEASGYTFKDSPNVIKSGSTEALVEAELAKNPKLLEMAEGLKQFYKDYYNRVNEHHIKEYGFPLARNSQYSGYVTRKLDAKDQLAPYNDILHSLMERRSLVPDEVRERMSSKPIELSDAFANAQDSISQFEHWIAFSEKARRLGAVFTDQTFKDIISDKYGAHYYGFLKSAFEHIVGTKAPNRLPEGAERYMDTVHTNIAAFLAGNPLSYLKQRAGLLAYAGFLNPIELKAGIDHYYENYEDAQKVMEQSPFLRARMSSSSPELRQVLDSAQKYYPGRFSWDKLRMAPVQVADLHTVKEGWWAVYQSQINKKVPQAQAIEYADRISDSTQSSSLIEQRSLAELSGGKVGKLMTVFTKPTQQMTGIADNLTRRAISDPLGKDAKTGVNNVIAAVQANLAFNASQVAFDAVASATAIGTSLLLHDGSDEADDRLQGAIFNAASTFLVGATLGPRTGMALMGSAIKAMVTDASNWVKKDTGVKGKPQYTYAPNTAMLEAVNDISDFASSVTDSAIGWGVTYTKQGGQLTGKQKDAVVGDVLHAWHLLNGASVLIPGGSAFVTTDAFVRYAKTIFPRQPDQRDGQPQTTGIPVEPFIVGEPAEEEEEQ